MRIFSITVCAGAALFSSLAAAQGQSILYPTPPRPATQAASAPSAQPPTPSPSPAAASQPSNTASETPKKKTKEPSRQAKESATESSDASARAVRRTQMPSQSQVEQAVAQQLTLPGYTQSGAPIATPQQPQSAKAQPKQEVIPSWMNSALDKSAGRTSVTVLPGVTEIIKVARNFPNRFQTPFQLVDVITTSEDLVHDSVGGTVVIATSSDKPIGLFLQDRATDRAIPITIIPEDIPLRDVRLVLDESWPTPVMRQPIADSSAANLPSGQSEYEEFLKTVLRQLAQAEIPDGHAVVAVQPEFAPNCQIPGLQITLGQMMEGPKTRIAVYSAMNSTSAAVPVQESGCYRSNVLAAGAFPRPVLQPGETTEIYVILSKQPTDKTSSSRRRQVLAQ